MKSEYTVKRFVKNELIRVICNLRDYFTAWMLCPRTGTQAWNAVRIETGYKGAADAW